MDAIVKSTVLRAAPAGTFAACVLLSLLAAAPAAAQTAAQTRTAAQSASPAPGAEAQLQAIRNALIEKAMGSTTRVSATAWINERGELMEASQFRTDMQVRGVRVMEYVDGDAPHAVVNVAESAAPAGVASVPECREPANGREPWRHPLTLRLQVDRPLDPQWATLSAQAGRWLDQAVRTSAQGEGVLLDTFAAPAVRNRYEEALWSFPQPRSTMVMTVRVRLQDGWEPDQSGARRHRWEAQARQWLQWRAAERRPMTIRLDWSLARTGEAPLLQQQILLPVMVDAQNRPMLQFDDTARKLLQREAAHRWQALQGVLDCEPLVVEARGQGDGQVMLMAGQDAGLRVGDRMVLVDGRLVPGRMLEADVSPHLALLEVQQVQAQRAQARQVAGPRLPPEGSHHWLAMPFGASLLAKRPEESK
jgi:hypothetical protein